MVDLERVVLNQSVLVNAYLSNYGVNLFHTDTDYTGKEGFEGLARFKDNYLQDFQKPGIDKSQINLHISKYYIQFKCFKVLKLCFSVHIKMSH